MILIKENAEKLLKAHENLIKIFPNYENDCINTTSSFIFNSHLKQISFVLKPEKSKEYIEKYDFQQKFHAMNASVTFNYIINGEIIVDIRTNIDLLDQETEHEEFEILDDDEKPTGEVDYLTKTIFGFKKDFDYSILKEPALSGFCKFIHINKEFFINFDETMPTIIKEYFLFK